MLIEEVLSSGSLCCYISQPFITTLKPLYKDTLYIHGVPNIMYILTPEMKTPLY